MWLCVGLVAGLMAPGCLVEGGTFSDGDAVECEEDLDCLPGRVCAGGVCSTTNNGRSDVGADTATDAPSSDTPSTDTIGGDVVDEDPATLVPYEIWGTVGVGDSPRHPAEGFAMCNIQDVRADDIDGMLDDFVPPEAFPRTPFGDVPSRCGDDFETLAWRLGNCERMSRGLEPLSCDQRLVWTGRQHSGDMVAKDYFDHTNREGQSPFDRLALLGIQYTYAGENIALYGDVEAAHIGWMNSQGHRENLLSPNFTHTGIGVMAGSQRRYMLTAMFIRPR